MFAPPSLSGLAAVLAMLAAAAGALGASPLEAPGVVEAPGPRSASYRLDTGDKLRVIIFGETRLSGDFVVADDGKVAFPLVGAVPAAGLSVDAFADRLRSRLADGYLKDPRVSAEVEAYRPFYILGEVQKPGEYPFITGLTVMNAVATAGGFSYRANTRLVLIRHAGADKGSATRLTLSTPVDPGDTILIRERFF